MRCFNRVARLLLLVLASVALQSCGYALVGRGNALPTYIQSIGVPQLINHSTTPEIDQAMTEAVRVELQGKGRYRVQPDGSGVDAVLTGTVTGVTLQPIAFNENRQVTSYAIVVLASVEFRDLKENRVLWVNDSFRITDEYPVNTDAAPDPVSLFTQDANARERVARRFAREVVTSIFEAF
jgi:hypothetical protein